MKIGTGISLMAVLLIVIFSSQAVAQTEYIAHLRGGNEVHLPNTTATGTVEAVLDGDTLVVSGTFSNLTSPVDTSIAGGAHIHLGYAGQNGGIEFVLTAALDTDFLGGSFPAESNTFVLTSDEIETLNERRYYVNIHTENYPAGELRGQIVPAADEVLRVNLSGHHETPPVLTGAQGGLVVERNDDEIVVTGAFSNLSSPYTASHIHLGYAGQAGGVEIPLDATLTADESGGFYAADANTFTLSQDQLDWLRERRLYVNIHSQNHPPGEIRGQIRPYAEAVFQANLSGATETPPVDTDATGAAIVELVGDSIIVTGSFWGLSSNQTPGGAHIHIGYAGQAGGVIFPLETVHGSNATEGTFPAAGNTFLINEDQLANLLARRYYVNVHSENYPPGEIRGQLLGEAHSYFVANLSGMNEIVGGGPVPTDASGGVAVERTADRIILSGSFQGLTSDLAVAAAGGAHLHIGGPGESGGIEVPLEVTIGDDNRSGVFDVAENTFTLESETVELLLGGRLYANVHSENFVPGEIRGSLLFDPHYFPTAAALTMPEDGAEIVLDGDSEQTFPVSWTGATDPNNNPVAYIWQLAADDEFDSLFVSMNVDADTAGPITFGDVDSALDAAGVEAGQTVAAYHRVVSTNGSLYRAGESRWVEITRGSVTSIDDEIGIPEKMALHQNYPNPFNPSTVISFDVPEHRTVTLRVYDLLGREVATLIDREVYTAGSHTVEFHSGSLGSGQYFYRLSAEGFSETRRMILIK
jgi:hypothetical protein